jgi:hypothetical protein
MIHFRRAERALWLMRIRSSRPRQMYVRYAYSVLIHHDA